MAIPHKFAMVLFFVLRGPMEGIATPVCALARNDMRYSIMAKDFFTIPCLISHENFATLILYPGPPGGELRRKNLWQTSTLVLRPRRI